jgi:hypothetical protein
MNWSDAADDGCLLRMLYETRSPAVDRASAHGEERVLIVA